MAQFTRCKRKSGPSEPPVTGKERGSHTEHLPWIIQHFPGGALTGAFPSALETRGSKSQTWDLNPHLCDTKIHALLTPEHAACGLFQDDTHWASTLITVLQIKKSEAQESNPDPSKRTELILFLPHGAPPWTSGCWAPSRQRERVIQVLLAGLPFECTACYQEDAWEILVVHKSVRSDPSGHELEKVLADS